MDLNISNISIPSSGILGSLNFFNQDYQSLLSGYLPASIFVKMADPLSQGELHFSIGTDVNGTPVTRGYFDVSGMFHLCHGMRFDTFTSGYLKTNSLGVVSIDSDVDPDIHHNDLNGLEGGNGSDEYYHLIASDYNSIVSGVMLGDYIARNLALSGTLVTHIHTDITALSGTLITDMGTKDAALSGTLSTEINSDVAALSGTLQTSIYNTSGFLETHLETQIAGASGVLGTGIFNAQTTATNAQNSALSAQSAANAANGSLINKDGSTPLTANWDAGNSYRINGGQITAFGFQAFDYNAAGANTWSPILAWVHTSASESEFETKFDFSSRHAFNGRLECHTMNSYDPTSTSSRFDIFDFDPNHTTQASGCFALTVVSGYPASASESFYTIWTKCPYNFADGYYNPTYLNYRGVSGVVYYNNTNIGSGTLVDALSGLCRQTASGTWYTQYGDTTLNTLTTKSNLTVGGNITVTGTEQVTRLGVGTPAHSTFLARIAGTGLMPGVVVEFAAYENLGIGAAELRFVKSHSATLNVAEPTVTNEPFGFLGGYGYNNISGIAGGVGLGFYQDGAAGVTYIPGRMEFYTGTSSASTLERMRISGSGQISMYSLPYTNPGVSGQLWCSGQTLMMSVG